MRIDKVKFATELARADVSVKELATRTGVSRVTISAIKSGKSCANDTAKNIAPAPPKRCESLGGITR